MIFSELNITVGAANTKYLPFDKGSNGAFVWRAAGASVFAPRVLASASTNDAASDKLTVQLNTPVVKPAAQNASGVDQQIGTDLVKTELRFLATTSKTDRIGQIDRHIALLNKLRGVVEDREVIYS